MRAPKKTSRKVMLPSNRAGRPSPAHNKSLQGLRSKFTCKKSSANPREPHSCSPLVRQKRRADTTRTHFRRLCRVSPSKVRCHGKISEINRDAAICDDRYLCSDLGSRHGDPRHKVRRCPPTEAGHSFLNPSFGGSAGWCFAVAVMPVHGLFDNTGRARL
jgi:hypothetical protein